MDEEKEITDLQTEEQQPTVEESSVPDAPQVDQQEINWQRANEVMKLQNARIKELEERLTQPVQQPIREEPDEFDSLPSDDYLTVEQARRLAAKMAEKTARKAVQESIADYDNKMRVSNDEARCQAKYEDYQYVMENFALPMIKNDPALAYKIQQSKNPAETAYKLGKLSDNYEESMSKASVSPKAEKILKNTQRPVSSNASGGLKSQAEHYSKMTKEQIWAESQKYARQA